MTKAKCQSPITVIFLENKLVGFDSGYNLSEDTLEAHYIGVDYEVNKEYEIYQNILYHFIELAITHKKKHLNLAVVLTDKKKHNNQTKQKKKKKQTRGRKRK